MNSEKHWIKPPLRAASAVGEHGPTVEDDEYGSYKSKLDPNTDTGERESSGVLVKLRLC